MQKSRVGSKGEILAPKGIREKLGLRPGTAIDFKAENKKLIAQPVPSVNDLLKEACAG